MVRRVLLVILMGVSSALSQSGQQPKLTVHTQVREDIFSGFLFNDMDRFESGVKKIQQMLKEDPNNAPALGWLMGSEMYRAVKAHEEGNNKEFSNYYAQSLKTMEKALSAGPKDQGVFATTGGTLILFADRLPKEQKTEAYRKGLELFKRLEAAQKGILEQLPLHMRGELLAGLAQATDRLGEREESRRYLNQIAGTLSGTPYEMKAKKWLEEPDAASKSNLVCQTCHEPGRIENVLRAQKQQ